MREKITQEVSQEMIKYLKDKHNMTIPEIAKLAGTTQTFISGIENGKDRFKFTFTFNHLTKIEESIPIFVSLAELSKEKLITKYAEKGQKVPKDMLEMHSSLIEILKMTVEVRKKAIGAKQRI